MYSFIPYWTPTTCQAVSDIKEIVVKRPYSREVHILWGRPATHQSSIPDIYSHTTVHLPYGIWRQSGPCPAPWLWAGPESLWALVFPMDNIKRLTEIKTLSEMVKRLPRFQLPKARQEKNLLQPRGLKLAGMLDWAPTPRAPQVGLRALTDQPLALSSLTPPTYHGASEGAALGPCSPSPGRFKASGQPDLVGNWRFGQTTNASVGRINGKDQKWGTGSEDGDWPGTRKGTQACSRRRPFLVCRLHQHACRKNRGVGKIALA